MKAVLSALAIVATVAFIGVAVSGDQQRADRESPVRLLPGYTHRRIEGVDTEGGRIWKRNGPDIHYDIGAMAGELARGTVDENPRMALIIVESPATGDIAVAMDEQHDMMIVSVDHYANFKARNVRSRKDVAEVLLMANTVKRIPK